MNFQRPEGQSVWLTATVSFKRKTGIPVSVAGRSFFILSPIIRHSEGDAFRRCTAHVRKESIETVQEKKADLRKFIEIRYEDLLRNPEFELRDLLNQLELPFPRKENRRFSEWLGKVGSVNHQNDYGQYEIAEGIAGETLKEFGYL